MTNRRSFLVAAVAAAGALEFRRGRRNTEPAVAPKSQRAGAATSDFRRLVRRAAAAQNAGAVAHG